MSDLRIGNGFDVHPFILGRDLVLGGKKIEYKFGLQGHSDADVLVHAIIDSLLGAANMPDIGQMFPNNDASYKNINSLELLRSVNEKLSSLKIKIVNIDSIIICQEPKISPYIHDMKANISRVIGIHQDRIGIKGKSTEGLGFTGRGEGIAASCIALIEVPA